GPRAPLSTRRGGLPCWYSYLWSCLWSYLSCSSFAQVYVGRVPGGRKFLRSRPQLRGGRRLRRRVGRVRSTVGSAAGGRRRGDKSWGQDVEPGQQGQHQADQGQDDAAERGRARPGRVAAAQQHARRGQHARADQQRGDREDAAERGLRVPAAVEGVERGLG